MADKERDPKVQAAIDHSIDCRKRKVSTCCDAPLNESYVITSGRHKGHGPRYCSKCGKFVFMV